MSTIGELKESLSKWNLLIACYFQTYQSSEPLESRQFTLPCSVVAIAFKFEVDHAVNATTAAGHVKNAIFGSTVFASQSSQMLKALDAPITPLRCGSTRQKRCHQRKSISARFASTRRFMDGLRWSWKRTCCFGANILTFLIFRRSMVSFVMKLFLSWTIEIIIWKYTEIECERSSHINSYITTKTKLFIFAFLSNLRQCFPWMREEEEARQTRAGWNC